MKTVYRSAVDLWIVVAIATPAAVLVYRGGSRISSDAPGGITLLLIGIGMAGLVALLGLPCRYTLTDDVLSIRCGLIHYVVPLKKVVRAEKSSSWLSAPAWSLRRVRVVVEDGSYVISPKDREAFISDIQARSGRARQS